MGNSLNRFIFRPPSPIWYDKLQWIKTKRGNTIATRFINRNAKMTVVFSHGNAEDLGRILWYFEEKSGTWGVNIFMYEYSGYGMSSGTPSEENLYADIEAAVGCVKAITGCNNENIILYGRSLGSGPSVHFASNYRVAGLVLQSPIASIHRVSFYTPMTLPGDQFCNIDKIAAIKCPILFIHGTNDTIVPCWHSKDMCRIATSPVTNCFISGGGHNDLESRFGNTIDRYVVSFVSNLLNERKQQYKTADEERTNGVAHCNTSVSNRKVYTTRHVYDPLVSISAQKTTNSLTMEYNTIGTATACSCT